jgi:hypothetical protein
MIHLNELGHFSLNQVLQKRSTRLKYNLGGECTTLEYRGKTILLTLLLYINWMMLRRANQNKIIIKLSWISKEMIFNHLSQTLWCYQSYIDILLISLSQVWGKRK